jgi:propionyl-CoA carboxylase alpha chain
VTGSGSISSVLVANRGEIARRVFATCRARGISTVAVFSDPDANSPHVAEADLAVRLPGAAAADTYLNVDALLAAAKLTGADAIHPGYGFGSENADFARAVLAAGLSWIGPPPAAIAAMGSKIRAKKLMAAAGVPVFDEIDPGSVSQQQLPLLVKASAGGGGRGMRVVRHLADLPAEIAAAQAEAASAFGDPTVFCEPYVERGRHIEVQLMADLHGAVWAIGERECSIQRRHQKVIEEAPSPLVERVDGMREQLFEAAVTAARAIEYVGAGTVEFLADESGRFFFLEMNTRLQVEHPVTECTTGLDLVGLQLDLAEGGRLVGDPPPVHGHCIEARLYAEDPAAGWLPQSGTLHRVEIGSVTTEFRPGPGHGIRLDSGVVDGSEISTYYDPMLAKVISYAPTRTAAARALAAALVRSRLHGPATNRDLLVRVLRHPAFLAGDTDTAFLQTHDLAVLSTPLLSEDDLAVSALAAALSDAAHQRSAATVNRTLPSGWRNLRSQPEFRRYAHGQRTVDIEYHYQRGAMVAPAHLDVVLESADQNQVVLEVRGVRRVFSIARYPGLVCVDSPNASVQLCPIPRFDEPTSAAARGSLLAQLPGAVVDVLVAVGDQVLAGQPLLRLEAMKMQHTITAPRAGTVTDLPAAVGRQVLLGDVLAVLSTDEPPPDRPQDVTTTRESS